MESIVLKMDENVFLPNGALNQLRREALEALENALLEPYRRTAVSDWQTDGRLMDGRQMEAAPEAKAGKPCLVCLTEKRSLLPVLWENPSVTAVYLDFSAYDPVHFAQELEADIAGTKKAGKRVFLALPRIFRQRSAELFEGMVQSLRDFRPDGFLIRTYEELSYVRENFPDYEMVIDHNLYTYNDLASAAFAGLGVSRNTVPLELNRGEIRRRDNRVSEMIVYGYYPLMVSAQCVHGNTAGCDSRPGISYLTDRYNVKFPVKNVCSACYNVIYNSLPVMLFTQMKELQKAGIGTFRLDFTVEDSAQAEEILQLYEEFADGRRDGYPDQWQEHYTNGHYKRGVE
jgi:putative protease